MQFTTSKKRSLAGRVLPFSLLLTLLAGGCVTTEGAQKPGLSNDPSVNLMRIARTAEGKGDMSSAAALYQQAATLSPTSVEPALALATTLRAQSRFDEALGIYERVIAMDPRNVEAYRGMGQALITVEQPRPALDSFNAALHIDTRDAKSWNGRGVALDLLGRHAEAQHAYRTGLTISQDSVALNNNLNLSLGMGGAPVPQAVADTARNTAGRKPTQQDLALANGAAVNATSGQGGWSAVTSSSRR